MSIRSYTFTLSPDTAPDSVGRIWGGMQFEHMATELAFSPDRALLSAAGETPLCRIDFCTAAGWSPSENLTPDQEGFYRRSIPRSVTEFGGEAEAVFVITSNDLELLSFPVTLYFTEVKRGGALEEDLTENISAMEASVKTIAEEVSRDKALCEGLLSESQQCFKSVHSLHAEIMSSGLSAEELGQVKRETEELIEEVEGKLASGEFHAAAGVWEKIIDLSVNEEIGSFISTVEEFPKIAKSSEFLLRVILPRMSESLSLGNFSFNYKCSGISYGQTAFFTAAAASASAVNEIRVHTCLMGDIVHSVGGTGGQAALKTAASILLGDRVLKGDIESLTCKLSGENLFPVGTRFIIYGKVAE